MLPTIITVLCSFALTSLGLFLRLHPIPDLSEADKHPRRARVLIWGTSILLLGGIVTCAVIQFGRQATSSGEVKAHLSQIEVQTAEIATLRKENNENNLKIQTSLAILRTNLSSANTSGPKVVAAIRTLSSKSDEKDLSMDQLRLISTQASLLASAIKSEVDVVLQSDAQKKAAWTKDTEQGLIQQGNSPEDVAHMMSSMRIKDDQFAAWAPVGERKAAQDALLKHRADINALIEIGKSDVKTPQSLLTKELSGLGSYCPVGPIMSLGDCIRALNRISSETTKLAE